MFSVTFSVLARCISSEKSFLPGYGWHHSSPAFKVGLFCSFKDSLLLFSVYSLLISDWYSTKTKNSGSHYFIKRKMKKEKEFHQWGKWGGDTKQMLKLICSRDKTATDCANSIIFESIGWMNPSTTSTLHENDYVHLFWLYSLSIWWICFSSLMSGLTSFLLE